MQEKTTTEHWDTAWARPPRARLPSSWSIGTLNRQRLLRRYVTAGSRFIEVGCAPGKMLAWTHQVLGADISGVDYSPRGAEVTRWLLNELGIEADIRCEDIHRTSFPEKSFDVVFSAGVIEHFDDPREIVEAHVRLVRPGGVALMTVPNYGGIYASLQRYFDSANLSLHNLDIMDENALRTLAPNDPALKVRSYTFGRASPGLVSLRNKWGYVGASLGWLVNGLALLQPRDVASLAPMLVLEIKRLDGRADAKQ
jgi:2-polyprenyl-3-methyl-5-hydroxy-6-metoxy-1,4-benzoquinol methylase